MLALVVMLVAGFRPLKNWLYEYSFRNSMNSRPVKSAATFWANGFSNPISDDQRAQFYEAIRKNLALSYMKYGSYPDLGVGELAPLIMKPEDNVLAIAAFECRLVMRSEYGMRQLREVLPNGIMKFAGAAFDPFFDNILKRLHVPDMRDEREVPVFCATDDRRSELAESSGVTLIQLFKFEGPGADAF